MDKHDKLIRRLFFEVPVMYNVLHQYAQSIYDFSGAGRKHNAGEYQDDNNKEPDPRRRNMPTGVSHEIPLLFQQCHLLTNGGYTQNNREENLHQPEKCQDAATQCYYSKIILCDM